MLFTAVDKKYFGISHGDMLLRQANVIIQIYFTNIYFTRVQAKYQYIIR